MPDYDLFLDELGISHLESEIKKVYAYDKLYVITDDMVFGIYETTLKEALPSYKLEFIVIPSGEESKSFDIYQEVIKKLISKKMKRNHMIVAFGGGVVGDLAGFVAATLYRGVPFIQIPTTLLAMVDSSIGGKVGIDLPEGKNLIGSFYNPKLVYINPKFLETLSVREYHNGLAEMIKAGLIGDKHLYQYLLHNNRVSIKEIQMAIQVKRDIVLIDPYDQKERMFLNFGHTFGHAIEAKHNYLVYKHGEAVSYGMIIALAVGVKLGETPYALYEEVKQLLIERELVKEPFMRASDYLEQVKKDKKYIGDTLQFVIVPKVGQAKIIHVTESELI
jgi:3-dehydroquinate synthase